MKIFSLLRQSGCLFVTIVISTSCTGKQQSPIHNEEVVKVTHSIVQDTSYGPGDIVQSASLDKAGNIWFGTTGGEGAFQYNIADHKFTNYTIEEGLCTNEVFSIFEDRSGNFWFNTEDGACRYNPGTGIFTNVVIRDGDDYFPASFTNPAKVKMKYMVTDILEDKAGDMWFGTLNHGVYRYDVKTDVFTNYLPTEVIKCMMEDKAGNIWIGSWSNGGAYHFNARLANHPCVMNVCKHNLQREQELKEHDMVKKEYASGFVWQDGLTDGMIAYIFQDRNGVIWIGTRDNGVCRYNSIEDKFTYFNERNGLCNNNVSCILEDNTGNLWFGSTVKSGTKPGGICRYDPDLGVFTKFTPMDGLENSDIFCSVEDKAGNLWFGGRYGRLFRFDPVSELFTDYSEKVHKPKK